MTPALALEQLLANDDWARRLALRLVGDPHEADDLVQRRWMTALRRPPCADSPDASRA